MIYLISRVFLAISGPLGAVPGRVTLPRFNFFLLFSPIDEAGSSILSQGAAGVTVLSIGDGLSASKESEDNNDESAKL